jgi:hypothetical protein
VAGGPARTAAFVTSGEAGVNPAGDYSTHRRSKACTQPTEIQPLKVRSGVLLARSKGRELGYLQTGTLPFGRYRRVFLVN